MDEPSGGPEAVFGALNAIGEKYGVQYVTD
jgi:hypothetical protein